MPQIPFTKQLDDFVNRNQGKDVQVLDMARIQHAGYSILQELEIAQMMDSIEDDMKRKKEKKTQQQEPGEHEQRLNNNEEDNIAQSKVSETKHDDTKNACPHSLEQSGRVQQQQQPKVARNSESSPSSTKEKQTMLKTSHKERGVYGSSDVEGH